MKQNYQKSIIIIAILLVISLSSANAAPEKGDKAPDFCAATLDSKTVTLSSFQGKYVVLDFWGSWCRNCILGFPTLVQTADKYSKNLQVIGVVCSDTPEKAQSIVTKKGLKWPNVISDDKCDIVSMYGVTLYPTKILIDPSGIILGIFAGETDELYSEIDKILAK